MARARRCSLRQAAGGEGCVYHRERVVRLGDEPEHATDAASLQVNRAARIAKARALLGMGLSNAQAAAALVTAIPTSYRYDVTASLTGGTNTLWDQPASQNRYTVGDSVQGNGRNILVKNAIPFFTAADRRVPAHYKIGSNGKDTVKSQDGGTFVIQVDSLWGPSTAVAHRRWSRRSTDRGRSGTAGWQPGRDDLDPERPPRRPAAAHRSECDVDWYTSRVDHPGVTEPDRPRHDGCSGQPAVP